jgi:type II secretory pathway pseudopilin PulG
MRRWRALACRGDGFTVIEVLVAAAVLVIGLLGAVALIDGANRTTISTQAREQGSSLQRELIEAARSIPYKQLTPGTVVSQVQATPGLGNSGAGPGWTIQRRGFTYQVSMGVCSVDDPSNGYGTQDPNTFCASTAGQPNPSCGTLVGSSGNIAGDTGAISSANGSLGGQQAIGVCGLDPDLDGQVDDLVQAQAPLCGGGACAPTPSSPPDPQPDNYKRIVSLVTWIAGGQGHFARQSTTVPNPGQNAGGPTVTSLSTTAPNPITNTFTGITVPFTATATSDAATMSWSIDGADQGTATNSLGTWSFSWSIGISGSGTEVMDGTYVIGVRAFNQYGTYGPTRALTITLNRRQAYAPTGFVGGLNGGVLDFEWVRDRERDIAGYRVYQVGLPDTKVCDVPASQATCQTTAPATLPKLYYVLALDHDNASPPQLREGDHSSTVTVTATNQAPNPPTNLAASPSGGNTVLAWSAPAVSDPDGDPIAFYRIYRDGQAYASRYDRTAGAQTTYTDTGTGGVQHTYWVTAVDGQLAESTQLGPVTR